MGVTKDPIIWRINFYRLQGSIKWFRLHKTLEVDLKINDEFDDRVWWLQIELSKAQ